MQQRVVCTGCGAHRHETDDACGVCGCVKYDPIPSRAPRDVFTTPDEPYEYSSP
jgi:hypothetical protein